VWEDKPEAVEEQLRTHLPVLVEVPERRILAENLPQQTNAAQQTKNPVAEAPNLFSLDEPQTPLALSEVEGNPEPQPPNHILIEGDNLHALTALTFTHEGKIDVIYIDPPYNTGNKDFKYNDRFVDREDSYRHSKWLSFMHKRLLIAKKLLNDRGVFFISIDENESHNLRLILDDIFGESNFIEQLIWNKRIPKNDKGIGNIHEYVYLYGKNYSSEHIFLQKKEGIEDVNEFVSSLKKRKVPIPDAEKEIKKFYKKNGYDRGITLYNSFDSEYRLWGKINVSWPNAKTFGPRYDVIHPETGKPCKVPDRGWRWTQETFLGLLDYKDIVRLHDGSFICGRIWFAKDENTQPSSIKFLEEVNDFLLRSIISTKSDGSVALIDVLSDSKFDYPKPIDLIHRLLASINHSHSIILDFFAGSGTTLHATMQLNAEDGGKRQCILVTNNENNIAEEVCYERNKRVIQGYTNSKGNWVEGLANNNLRYYKTDFVGSARTEQNRRKLTRLSTALLQIKEDCYTDITAQHGFDSERCHISTNEQSRLLIVLYHSRNQAAVIEQLREFIRSLPETDEKIKLYAFGDEKEILLDAFYDVAERMEAVPLPDAIYNAYRATFRSLKLDRKTPVDMAPETDDTPATDEEPNDLED